MKSTAISRTHEPTNPRTNLHWEYNTINLVAIANAPIHLRTRLWRTLTLIRQHAYGLTPQACIFTPILTILHHPKYIPNMLTAAQVERTHTLLQKVGQFIQHHSTRVHKKDVVEKDLNSLVSYVDQEAEERLVEGLSYILPEATFITEEEMVEQKDSELQWIIDPLDGTTNYLHGVPAYAISVGLMKDDELEAGFVYDIPFDKLYWALRGEGAYKEKEPIRVADNDQLKNTLIATGFPYQDFEQIKAYMHLLSTVMEQTRGIRRLGSAAIDLAYTAEGRFDVFYEYGLHPWDVAGGAIIVKEAGGFVCNFSGGEEFLDSAEIIAGSLPVKKEFLSLVDRAFLKF